MFIDLLQLEDEELRVEHQYSAQFDLQDQSLRLISAPSVRLTARRAVGKEIRIRGHLQAAIGVPCDRCLAYFDFPVDADFDLFYAPIEVLAPHEDVPLVPKDLAYGFYRDNLIDVDGLAREQIFLALPFRRLCKADCPGLCLLCGVDLNVETCSCDEESVKPHWSALRDLKKTMQ